MIERDVIIREALASQRVAQDRFGFLRICVLQCGAGIINDHTDCPVSLLDCSVLGVSCSDGVDCCSGVCEAGSCADVTISCGSRGQACCSSGTECVSGLECRSGTCRAVDECGSEDRACCAGSMCDEGFACDGGMCVDAAVATKIYGAGSVTASSKVRAEIEKLDRDYGRFPICLAKTQTSFTADPTVRGAPEGHSMEIREVRLLNGAGFIVALTGNMMTMPGLPKVPAAEKIDIDSEGNIIGLF